MHKIGPEEVNDDFTAPATYEFDPRKPLNRHESNHEVDKKLLDQDARHASDFNG